MHTLSIRRTLAAAPSAVWEIVSDFANARYLPFEVLEARGQGAGATRRIRTPDGTRMVDRLDLVDHASRTLRYSLDTTSSDPGPMTSYVATMRVLAGANSLAELEWSGQVEFAPNVDEKVVLPVILGVYLTGMASIESMLRHGNK